MLCQIGIHLTTVLVTHTGDGVTIQNSRICLHLDRAQLPVRDKGVGNDLQRKSRVRIFLLKSGAQITLGCLPDIHIKSQDEVIDTLLQKEWAQALKEAMHKRTDYPEVRRAANYLKRVRNSYSSSGRSFACQPFDIRTLFDQIWEMSFRLGNVIIEQQSFEVLIPHYDRPESFFYADPPYFNSEYVYEADFGWEHHVLLRDTLAKCKGKWLISQVDCPEIRTLFKDFEILDFKRIHPMVQKYTPGKQFGELLNGNYDLLERERDVPLQMSLNELLGEPINVNQILKERVTCKKRNPKGWTMYYCLSQKR